jgi:hypothetical protein
MSMTEQTTAEIIAEHAHEEGVAVYYSRSMNLTLVRRPKDETLNALRQLQVVQQPVRYNFAPAGTIVVHEGQDMLPDGPGGELQDAIAWLDSHVNFNLLFYRDGHEPDRALPIERDFLSQVNTALVSRDVSTIQRLLAAEQSTHRRQVLLDSAISALTALRDAGEDIGDAPAAAGITGLEGVERAGLVERAMKVGLEVPADTSDEQLRAALLVLAANDVS